MYIYMYIYMYMYICIYTYMYIYIHIYTCFGSYHMSIQSKKVKLIQNEKDIHVHVLGYLGLSNSKVLDYLTSASVLIVELSYLNSFYQR